MAPAADGYLTKLRVGNFKGFDGPHEVRLSKLTLVFGPNSAGKSALLHALLLLSQSLPQHAVGVYSESSPSLLFNGQKVDLGGFRNALHRHDLSRTMNLGISQSDGEGEETSLDMELQWDQWRGEGVISSFRYRVEGRPENDFVLECPLASQGSNVAEPAQWRLSSERSGLPELKAVLSSLLPTDLEFRTSRGAPQDVSVEESLRLVEDDLDAALEQVIANRPYGARGFLPLPVGPLELQDARRSSPMLGVLIADQEWARLLSNRGRSHWKRLISVRHIGPLREAPQRAQVRLERATFRDAMDGGAAGSATAEVFLQHPELITATNEWLKRLGMPYEVSTRTLELEDAPSAGSWGTLLLDDLRTSTRVSLSDVGVGVSQVLPIIAQVVLGRGGVTLIEQPELHLHPGAQTQLGDLLASSVRSGGQVIVETHSEHLLLRLLRRIRGGELSASDLEVVYVDSLPSGGSVARRLRIDDGGEFLDEWPHGFFEERVDELLD